jgi:uncharacterized damage-inducible protein DinB
MKDLWWMQYNLIKSARAVLLTYCESLTPEHFVATTPGFGHDGSIRNLLVHNANTYHYWIGFHCFGRAVQYPPYEAFTTVEDCRRYLMDMDELVAEFIKKFAAVYSTDITSSKTTTSPLAVFTHVTTHEFHHKGQILSMSRHMGYIPVDTDIIR